MNKQTNRYSKFVLVSALLLSAFIACKRELMHPPVTSFTAVESNSSQTGNTAVNENSNSASAHTQRVRN